MSEKIKTLTLDTHRSSAIVRALQFGLLLALGNVLLIVSARVQVPFWPVPMTMETFAVLVIGVFYSRRLALATVAAFLVEGLSGVPVFAHGGGPAYFFGPTGGYLVGFLAAVALLASLKERGWCRSGLRLLVALTAADAVIFALGFAWLAVLIGPAHAWVAGVVPFLLGDALKIALVAATAGVGKQWLARRSTT